MNAKTAIDDPAEPVVTIDEVNRVLELGRLLLSVLTPKELEELQGLLYGEVLSDDLHREYQIGNTSVT